jgi:HPt (histidine-containing phosphotransfer) domain-containing protein
MNESMNMKFDYQGLLATTEGDEDLARELISIFLEDVDGLMDGVDRAAHDGQANELHQAAHKLKGSLGSLSAGAAHDLAQAVETMAINKDMNQAETALGQLKIAIAELITVLQKFERTPTT